MRLLLSRGTVAGAILLIVVVIPRVAPPQRHLAAQATAVVQVPIPAPVSAPTPRWPARFVTGPSPSPASHRARVAIQMPSTKIAPAVPARLVVGTAQMGLINQDRAGAGLPLLQWNDCLAGVATGQAARMAAQGYISHAGGRILDLGCHLGTRTGENIGFQGGSIDDAAMNAWFIGDPLHRANILGPYHYVGVAWVWGRGAAYLAIEFG